MMRGSKPFLFTNCKTGEGIPELVALIEQSFCSISTRAYGNRHDAGGLPSLGTR